VHNVCFWHKADITTRSTNVRFGVKRTFFRLASMSVIDPNRHSRFTIAAVQFEPEPHFTSRKSLL
jgi:hypothetical protein